MSSDQNGTLSDHVHRLAYRWFSWTVTGLTVVLFLLLVVSALLSDPAAGTEASMWWTTYQIARSLAFSLALYFVVPFVPVVIAFWALSDGSSSTEDGSLATSLSARMVLLVVIAVLGRFQASGSVFEAVSAVQASQVVVILVGFCVAVVGIPLVVFRVLDDSEEIDGSEDSDPENQPVADTEAQ